MITIKPGLNAREFRAQLQQSINRLGLAVAYVDGGLVILYSGPSKAVTAKIRADAKRKKLIADFRSNWTHSQRQAADLGGKRIDDTTTGLFLDDIKLPAYFSLFYGTKRRSIKNAVFSVWVLASREFMKARFHAAATSVCGADPKRVFRKVELGQILQNPHVETINNRPIQLFRDFHAINDYEVYRLFCVTELLEAKQYAEKTNTPEAWRSYRERRKFFVTERQLTIAKTPAFAPDEKVTLSLHKRRVLATYSVAKIMGLSPAATPTHPTPHAVPPTSARRPGHGSV